MCEDSRDKGYSYAGPANITFNNIQCQRWDTQSPNRHSQGPSKFPEKNLSLAENYCRNPDGEARTWCYTTDSAVRWKLCDVESCGMYIYYRNLKTYMSVIIGLLQCNLY